MSDHLTFAEAIAHIESLLGRPVSVEVNGQDPQGQGSVVELTGTLRAPGPDPDDPEWGAAGPRMFGFEGQPSAFYLDPDAFVDAWTWGEFLRVETTFGSVEVAGPILRPDWF